MLLSNKDIIKYMEHGSIVIDPFNPNQLNNVSYDLTLGPWVARYIPQESPSPWHDLNNPIKDMFAIKRYDDGFWMSPGERVLGHSLEFAGGRIGEEHAITTHLQATSTAARIGLTACMCAGWGDVGFINRWTFEIQNMSPLRLFIPPKAIIAQLCFQKVSVPTFSYHEKGNYQGEADLEQLKNNWKPESMLPKKLKTSKIA